jgi:hypothetical protein
MSWKLSNTRISFGRWSGWDTLARSLFIHGGKLQESSRWVARNRLMESDGNPAMSKMDFPNSRSSIEEGTPSPDGAKEAIPGCGSLKGALASGVNRIRLWLGLTEALVSTLVFHTRGNTLPAKRIRGGDENVLKTAPRIIKVCMLRVF